MDLCHLCGGVSVRLSPRSFRAPEIMLHELHLEIHGMGRLLPGFCEVVPTGELKKIRMEATTTNFADPHVTLAPWKAKKRSTNWVDA